MPKQSPEVAEENQKAAMSSLEGAQEAYGEMKSEEVVPEGKVKIRILRFVGKWVPGQEVIVDEAHAKELCAPRIVALGEGKTENQQKAISVAEAEKLESMPFDLKKMTCKDMADMGRKNIVPTPRGDAFDKKLQKMMEPADEKKAAKKAAQPRY